MEKTQTYILLAVAGVMAVVISALIIVSNSKKTETPSGDLPGLSEGPAPWAPEYKGLAERIRTLKLPPPGRETFHVHARLAVYVDGKPVTVPPNIGFDTQTRTVAGLHTHETDGIIHLEADQPFEATISQFFSVWGVKFTDTQLGSYKNEGDKMVQVFVNGQPVPNPAEYKVNARDNVVVGYGAPNSFPKTIDAPFPAGL